MTAGPLLSSTNSNEGDDDDMAEEAARELNDLRLVFANIAGSNKFVALRRILKLDEVNAQIAEGDVDVEDLESAWLEACAVEDVSSVDPNDNDGPTYHVGQRASWGVCTELSFEGFLHFLRLCEERAPLPAGVVAAAEDSPKDPQTGHNLMAARHRMIGLLRATLTIHQRGRGGEEEIDSDHLQEVYAKLGETLHMSMVRAAVEEGLAHHSPETLLELVRTGVYKESEAGAKLDRDEKKALLRLRLLNRKISYGELVRSGTLKEGTPGQLASEWAQTARRVSRHLQNRSAGSAADLLRAADAEGSDASARHHHRRPSLDELETQGIYRTQEQQQADERRHRLVGDFLQQELSHRTNVEDLKKRGIYLSQEEEAKHGLERSMLADQLSSSFRNRPYREDLIDRGLLEASQLKIAFQSLEKEQGGAIKTVNDVLKWPLLANAVKDRVVGMPALKEAFASAMTKPRGAGGGGGGGKKEEMRYEEFDKFLSSAKTTQVEDEPYSLKLWALMRMRPDLEELEHHEGNQRRNALMARELEQELGKREPLERLANKGIYLEKTPAEVAVERAHLTHTLAHGLAHRPALAELSHKGVYLEGVEPDKLEKAHRDARNYLEGTLSVRPSLNMLQDWGYLEADELEEAFTELVLNYKHDAGADPANANATTGSADDRRCPSSTLLLPTDRLADWGPVQKMLRSGAAMEEDVAAAMVKAEKASFYPPPRHQATVDGGDNKDAPAMPAMVDFVGFLEFIHSLDIEVDGLGVASGKIDDHDDNDPEAAARHARRLQMRRERAAHAAEEGSYGTLKEHLLALLRARPGKHDPETQRVAKEFHSTEAVDLEKNLIKNHLEGHLRSLSYSTRASFGSSNGGGTTPASGGERTTRIKELELAMNKRLLKHSLATTSGGTRAVSSRSSGVSRSGSAAVAGHRLDMEAKREIVGDSLGRRSSLDELANQGIFQSTTPLQHSLDRHLIERRLSRSLENPRRPSKKDLVDHGIYIDATPRELQMEHYMAARFLKKGLEGRDTIQDLKDQGIYQPEDSVRAHHEKLLVKALLQRRLSNAFSKEEVERLKQKGVYKEAEHEKLEAERLLVTRQLARLVSKRPDPEQLEREQPGLMEAGTLALVFEERVMPRAAGGSAVGAGSVAPADPETEGGPEHLVSFDGLMTWPDVQEHLAGDGGEDTKREMARHFELCDSDGDGYITFSQFLRWVELCDLNPEDHLQETDSDLNAEYTRLEAASGRKGGIILEQAAASTLVKRWAASASLDREALEALWGIGRNDVGKRVPVDGNMKQAKDFKSFCRLCEARSSAAHQLRLKELLTNASTEVAKGKENLRATLAAKLSARPDLDELRKNRIYREGGLDPAMVHLERNLIAISLKEQLLARPAVEDLENRGIKPSEESTMILEQNSSKLREALDSTMLHDDAQWRSDPSMLAGGSREEVSALLQKRLSKRPEKSLLTNKGIYVGDTDANYALLVHQVLRAHRGFKHSSAQLIAEL